MSISSALYSQIDASDRRRACMCNAKEEKNMIIFSRLLALFLMQQPSARVDGEREENTYLEIA
jgi:hypothetical protein